MSKPQLALRLTGSILKKLVLHGQGLFAPTLFEACMERLRFTQLIATNMPKRLDSSNNQSLTQRAVFSIFNPSWTHTKVPLQIRHSLKLELSNVKRYWQL